jgi:hypothetical protein
VENEGKEAEGERKRKVKEKEGRTGEILARKEIASVFFSALPLWLSPACFPRDIPRF